MTLFSGKSSVDGMSVRAPDTNIVTLQLNQLTDPPKIHAGDPVTCSNSECTAVLCHLSNVNMTEDQQVEWFVMVMCIVQELSPQKHVYEAL